MIIVLCREVQMVNQPDGFSQPGMRKRLRKQRSFQSANSVDKLQSRLAELRQNVLDAAIVVPGVMGLPIL